MNKILSEFLTNKGLLDEYIAFEKECKKKEKVNQPPKVDYEWKFEYMLGDADGYIKSEIAYKAEERDNWIKYLEALGKCRESIELITIEDEWRPNANIDDCDLLELFNGNSSTALDNVKMKKVPAVEPVNKDLQLDSDISRYVEVALDLIYLYEVKPWIDAGADESNAREFFNKVGTLYCSTK